MLQGYGISQLAGVLWRLAAFAAVLLTLGIGGFRMVCRLGKIRLAYAILGSRMQSKTLAQRSVAVLVSHRLCHGGGSAATILTTVASDSIRPKTLAAAGGAVALVVWAFRSGQPKAVFLLLGVRPHIQSPILCLRTPCRQIGGAGPYLIAADVFLCC